MNRKIDADATIAQIPLFANLGRKEMHAVRNLFSLIEVKADYVLAREGAHGNECFVIVDGTAAVDRDGVRIAEVGPGTIQGEMSVLDGGPRTATVTAITDMTILVATVQEFNALLDSTPTVARQMLPVLAQRVRALALAGEAITL